MFSAADYACMARALRLAEKGLYSASPNPRVGCVIVRNGEVIGEGWHERAGEAHAEIHALQAAGARAKGATTYVTLEPCSHHGRTPPCTAALIAAGVRRVVVAMQDPNPLVAGNGLKLLQQAGIAVETGLLEPQARELNTGFVSRMTRGRPWLRLKIAASLDGRTALSNRQSRWITGEPARRDAHRLRARSCAVLTGIGTVLADDPRLDVRAVDTPRQPLRVVLDSALQTPPGAKMLAGGCVLIITGNDDPAKMARLRDAGAEIQLLPLVRNRIDLAQMAAELGRRALNEVTVEAGATLNGALLQAGLADELVMYAAPVLLGDAARGMFALPELVSMSERHALKLTDVTAIGQDLRIRALLN